jgi:hypothetical protein
MPASGTGDYPWTVVLVWKPRWRSKCAFSEGIGRSACSNCLDRGPGRIAGSGLLSDAQRLER